MSDSESKTSTETGVQSVVHTPGPWRTSAKNGRVVVALSELANEKVATAANTAKPPVAWANARLIAAAPELLEAIQAALRIEPLWMPPDDENNPEYDAEFAALAMMRNQFKAVVAKVV